MARNGPLELATQDWGGDGHPLMFVHATGFCARIWDRVTAAFPDRHCFGYDQRGHGDSGKPEDPAAYEWTNYGDDCLAVLDDLGIGRTDAVGHSSGAATLVLAAAKAPERFGRLVLMEPIIFPPGAGGAENPLVEGARRRRMEFDSRSDLIERLGAKPPKSTWDPRVLEDYADHAAFDLPDGRVRLKCPGRLEAEMYAHGGSHGGWDELPRVRAECLVLCGEGGDTMPPAYWRALAERIPRHEFAVLSGRGHFAPMEDPEGFAAAVHAFLDRS